MTTIQKQQISEAVACVEPLRTALNALPNQDSQDSLVRQCLDAGRSLCEWTIRLSMESPIEVGAAGKAIPRDTLQHVAMIGMFASAAAYKLHTKDGDNGYKWASELAAFIQQVFNCLAWDYQPPNVS